MDARSLLALAVSVVAASLIAFVLYRRTSPTLPLRMRAALGVLRWIAAFLVLALVLDPVLRVARTTSSPPVVAVLVDASRSMAYPGPQGKSGVIAEVLSSGFLEQLGRKADLRFFAFSDTCGPVTAEAAGKPAASGSRTDLAGAISSARERLEVKPAALVVITDGAVNYGEDALRFCSDLKVPVYPVSLARPRPTPDISIDRIEAGQTAYAGSRVPVVVYASGRSAPGGSAALVVSDSTGEVARQVAPVPASGARTRIAVEVDAGRVGLHGFTASLAQFDGEEVTANNSMDFSIKVVQAKIKVTVVAPRPSWDFAFARRNLEGDPNVELAAVFSPGSSMAIKSPLFTNDLKRAIAASDVVVVLRGARLGAAARDLEQMVWKGGAALLVAPDGTGDVAEALNPLVVRSASAGPAMYRPELTEGGAEHAILDMEGAAGARMWASLPPVPVDASIAGARPEASVLLGGEGTAGEVPLLAVMRHGLGRVAALSPFDLWRWDLMPRGFGMEQSAFRHLLSGCVRWLTENEEARRLVISTGKPDYLWGEPVAVFARVVDESLRPLGGSEVTVRLVGSGSAPLEATLSERSAGNHTRVIDLLAPGDYTIEATATLDGEAFAEDAVAFSVSRRGLEDAGFDGDAALLAGIAEATGGRVYAPGDAADLARDLTPGRVISTTYKELRLRVNLPTFLVLAALLGTEWLIRRRRLLA